MNLQQNRSGAQKIKTYTFPHALHVPARRELHPGEAGPGSGRPAVLGGHAARPGHCFVFVLKSVSTLSSWQLT